MQSFVYSTSTARIIFGRGSVAQLPLELQRLGVRKPYIITTAQQKTGGEQLLELAEMPKGILCSTATMHTPLDVTQTALEVLQTSGCDGLVSLGGGSTVGLSKALSLRTNLPQVAIPTTYAGSEVTPILGETVDGVKKTQRSSRLLPNVVIYDVDFTLSLSSAMTASSGLNAIAHAVEALYAHDANPITSLMAEQGIQALALNLPTLVNDPSNVEARSQAQYGAWLCGTCLGAVSMSLHHKLCHVLGGLFNLPHAETHSIVLPYAIAYNAPSAPLAMRTIASALGKPNTPAALTLYEMLWTLNLPTSLQAIGMPSDGVEPALELVFRDSYSNPRPLEKNAIKRMLSAALAGSRPTEF